jgi:hypothetical protein
MPEKDSKCFESSLLHRMLEQDVKAREDFVKELAYLGISWNERASWI